MCIYCWNSGLYYTNYKKVKFWGNKHVLPCSPWSLSVWLLVLDLLDVRVCPVKLLKSQEHACLDIFQLFLQVLVQNVRIILTLSSKHLVVFFNEFQYFLLRDSRGVSRGASRGAFLYLVGSHGVDNSRVDVIKAKGFNGVLGRGLEPSKLLEWGVYFT